MKYFLVVSLALLCCFLGGTAKANDYNLEIVPFRGANDTLFIDLWIQRTSGVNFMLGEANFVVNIDTSVLDITSQGIKIFGPWHNNAQYEPMTVGGTLDFLNVTVIPTPSSTGLPVTATRTLIARLYVTIKDCNEDVRPTWRSFSGVINDISSVTVKPFATFIDPPSQLWVGMIANVPSNQYIYCAGDALVELTSNFSGAWSIVSSHGTSFAPITTTPSDTDQVFLNIGNALAVSNDTIIVTKGICRDTIVLTVFPIQAVTALPPFGATTGTTPAPVCAGSTYRFSASGPSDWQILNGGIVQAPGFVSGVSFVDVNFPAGMAGMQDTLVLRAASGCGQSDTIFVQVQPVTLIVAPPPSGCSGNTQTFTSGNPATNWIVLSGSPGTVSTLSGPVGASVVLTYGVTTEPRQDTIIAITNGCADSAIVALYPNELIAGPASVCPESGSYVLNTGVPSSNWSFTTNASGASLFGSPGSFAIYTPGTNTTGFPLVDVVRVDYGGGCFRTFNITVNSSPLATVHTGGFPATICENQFVTLQVAPAGFVSYQWLYNGGPIPAATAPTYDAFLPGDYSVVVSNGTCTDTSVNAVTVIVNPVPNPIASGPTMLILPATSVPYTVANVGLNTIQWTRNGSLAGITGSATANPSIDFTTILSDPSLTDTVVVELRDPVTFCSETDTILVNLNFCNAIAGTESLDTVVCFGTPAYVYVDNFVGDTIYWISSANAGGPWANVSTGNGYNDSKLLETTGITATTYFRAVAGNTLSPSCLDTSGVVMVTVTPFPDKGLTTGGGIYCQNASATLTYSGSTTTRQWQESANGITGWSNIIGATGVTYATPPITANRFYRIVVTEGCFSDTGDVVFVQYAPLPSGTVPATQVQICQGGTTAPLGATVTSGIGFWTSSRAGTFSPSVNDPNATFTDLGTGEQTVSLYFVITSGTCTPVVLQRQLLINAPSSGSFTSVPASVCAGGNTAPLGAAAFAGTGVWSAVPSIGAVGVFDPSITDPNARYITDPSNSGGSIQLNWTVTNGVCPPAVYSQTLNVLVPVVSGTFPAIAPNDICAGSLSGALNGTALSGTGSYSHNGGGTIVNIAGTNYYQSVAADAGLTITITFTVTNGSCTPLTLQRSITVRREPLGYFVGPLPGVCSNPAQVARFHGIAVVGTGRFEIIGPFAGTFVDNPVNDSAQYTPATGVAETITVAWIMSNPPCVEDTVLQTLNVGVPPLAGTITPVPDICSGASTAPFNVVGNNAVGTWSIITSSGGYIGQGGFSDPTSPTARYNSVAADANRFVAVQYTVCQPGCGCTTTTDEFFVNNSLVNGSFTPAPADICQGSVTAPLTGFAGPGNTGQWVVNPDGTFGNVLNPNTTFTPNPGFCGTTTLTWQVTSGGCTPALFQQQLYVACQPAGVFAVGPSDVCFQAGAQTNVFSATMAAGTTGRWESDGSGVFTNPTGTSTRYVPGSGDAGSAVTLFWITESPPCTPDTHSQVVNVVQPPIGVFNTNVPPVCAGSSSIPLNAVAAIGVGRWETPDGFGSFIDASGAPAVNDPNAQYLSDLVNDAGFTRTLRWIVSTGPTCAEDTNARQVNVLNVTLSGTFPALNPDTICEGDPSGVLSATYAPLAAIPPTQGTWSSSAAGVFLDATNNPDPNDPNARYVHLASVNSGVDSVTLTWTVTRGSCAGITFTQVLYISKAPLGAFGTNPGNICQGDVTVPLVGQSFEGTGHWSCSNCSGFFITSNPVAYPDPTFDPNAQYQSVAADGGNIITLEWNVEKVSCPPVVYTQNILVYANPLGSFTSVPATICASDITAPLGATTTIGTGTWSCSNCQGGFTTPTSDGNARYIPVDADGGQIVTLIWTVTNGTCPPVVYTQPLQVDTLPVGSFSTILPFVCPGSANPADRTTGPLGATLVSPSGGRWTTNGYGTFINGINNPNAEYISSPLDDTLTVSLIWRVGNGVCDSVDYVRLLRKFPLPKGGINNSIDTICTASATSGLGGFTTVGNGRWLTTNGTGVFSIPNTNGNASYTSGPADANSKIELIWRVGTADCPSDSVDYVDSVFVKGITPPGIISPINPDTTICQGDSVTITATGGVTYIWNTTDVTRFRAVSPNVIVAKPVVTQRFDVLVTDPATGCVFQDTVLINVQPGNSLTITAASSTICPGEQLTLNLSQFPAGAFSNVVWTPVPFNVSDPINPIVRPLQTTTYIVTAVTGNGCTSSQQFTVNVLSFTDPQLGLSNQDICGTFDDYFLTINPASATSCQNRVWFRNNLQQVLAWDADPVNNTVNILANRGTAGRDTVDYPIPSYGKNVYVVQCNDPNTGCTIYLEDSVWSAEPPTAGFYGYPKVQEVEENLTFPIARAQARLPVTPIYNPNIQFISDILVNTTAPLSSDSLDILWYFGDTALGPRIYQTDILNPEVQYTRPGKFTVLQIVTEVVPPGQGAPGQDCQSLLIITDYVEIKEEEYVFPNAFSPNGDNLNDLFRPLPLTARPDVEYIRIFDRWGNMVYETKDRNGWDGNDASGRPFDPATYTYKAKINRIGTDPAFYEGIITLIR